MMGFYVLQFATYKVRVDVFSFLYSKSILAKLSQFVFGATFGELRWQFVSRQFVSICSCLIRDYCLSVFKLAWLSGLCARL